MFFYKIFLKILNFARLPVLETGLKANNKNNYRNGKGKFERLQLICK